MSDSGEEMYDEYDSDMDCASVAESSGDDCGSIADANDMGYEDGEAPKEYALLRLDEVLSRMNEIATRTADVIQLPIAAIRVLLRIFKWDCDKLIEKFYEYEDVYAFLDATVQLDLTNFLDTPKTDEPCPICCEDSPLRGLRCGHSACVQCWNDHIDATVRSRGSVDVKCMECSIVLNDEQVASLVQNKEDLKRYETLLGNVFVTSNRLLKWCPGANCQKIIQVKSIYAQAVYCECGEDVCGGCNQGAHPPLSCDLAEKFIRSRISDEVTSSWIDKYTRPCPKCKTSIQKEGGCNYMRCVQESCKCFFCWTCMKVLAKCHEEHGCQTSMDEDRFRHGRYNDLPSELDGNNSKAKFLHYGQLENKDRVLKKRIQTELVPVLKDNQCSDAQIDQLSRVMQELLESDRVVSYTWACIHFLKLRVDEKNLSTLAEEAVTKLSEACTNLRAQFGTETPRMFKKDTPVWGASFIAFPGVYAEFREIMCEMQRRRQAVLEFCSDASDKGIC